MLDGRLRRWTTYATWPADMTPPGVVAASFSAARKYELAFAAFAIAIGVIHQVQSEKQAIPAIAAVTTRWKQ